LPDDDLFSRFDITPICDRLTVTAYTALAEMAQQ